MGALTDPVLLLVSSHSHNTDGTSRNDSFSYTTTLANYATDLVTYATPLYNQVANERINTGSAVGTFTGESYKGGSPASTSCDLRVVVQIGVDAGSTPLKYHLMRQDILSNDLITSPTSVYTWIKQLLDDLKPVNLYTGGVNFR